MTRSNMNESRYQIEYRPDIDGLRGIAVLAVVLFHAFPNFIKGGFVGVDIFFVISGYLITSILLIEQESSEFTILKFYSRRIRRIFPALIIVILSIFIFGWFFLAPGEYKSLGHHVFGGATFLSNFLSWKESGYFESTSITKPLWHLWSLAIEEQFYILWPLAMWILWNHKVKRVLITSLLIFTSFVFCLYLTSDDSSAAFYSPPSRIWEIMIGAMLANYPLSTKTNYNNIFSFCGLIYILLAFIFINESSLFPGLPALLPTIGAALIILAGPNAFINRTILSRRIIVFLGLVSFPFYLWHWPLLSFSKMLSEHEIVFSGKILLIMTSLFLAWVTYKFVETPIKHTPNQYIIKILIALMVFSGSVGLYCEKKNGFEARMPKILKNLNDPKYLQLISSKGWRQGICNITKFQDFSGYSQCPVGGNQHATESIFLWGDSQAAHLYPGYLKRFGDTHKIIQRTGDACPPLLKVGKENLKYCKENNDSIFNFLKNEKPSTVVLAARWQIQPWDHLGETIKQLKKLGIKNIDLIGPFPFWINGLIQQLFLEFKSGKTMFIPKRMNAGLMQESAPIDKAMKDYAKELNVRYISPLDILCNQDGCITRLGETSDSLITFDNSHLTRAGSEFLVSNFPK